MERKTTEGPIRNKEKSKEKLLHAVGKILRTKGHAALKVNNIAAVAGLDKKLIYNYFGSVDKLIDEYIRSQDFWNNAIDEKVPEGITDGGQALLKSMFFSQFEFLFNNKELQKIILWELSEERKSLKQLFDDREKKGDILFRNVFDPHFGGQSGCFRGILALLVAGIYYLDIHTDINITTFCGLDIKSKAGRAEVEHAISFIIDQAYSDLPDKGNEKKQALP